MISDQFQVGELYHRRNDIHAVYKGQERGGIITPVSHPVIFIITGESGKQHGYKDHWSSDQSRFFYHGEGQSRDMRFIKGNRALRDHQQNGKSVLLFEQVKGKKGWLRFLGEVEYADSKFENAPDSAGKIRKSIVFAFRRVP